MLPRPLNLPHIPIGQTLSRSIMSQIDNTGKFIDYLKSKDIEFEKNTIPTHDLKSTQSEFDPTKIIHLMASDKDKGSIVVASDKHVLDGHHRWVADHATSGKTKAVTVDLPILDLLRVAREYTTSLNEEMTHKEFGPMLDSFVSFASEKLGIKSLPNLKYKEDHLEGFGSFGGYNPSKAEITIHTKGRHPVDIFRTTAHELIHHKQNEDGRIKDVAKEGSTGSDIENEANAVAGQIMRWYAKANPDHFKLCPLGEATFVVGVPCSGKDRIIRHLKETGHWQETNLAGISKSLDAQKLIVSCAPENVDDIRRAADTLRENAFATSLIFVDATNEISKYRNEKRTETGKRALNEHLRFSKHKSARASVTELAQIFEGKTIVVDNSSDNPANREEATNSLKKIYTDDTPGQSKPKRKLRPKVQQEVTTNNQPVTQGLPTGGIGAEIAADGSSGLGGLGGAVSMPWSRLSESVQKWASKPETRAKFIEKYGENASAKLYETACEINDMMGNHEKSSGPKSLRNIRNEYKQRKF